MHILLAEDTEQTRLTFSMVLQSAGYEVTAVEDGRKALDQILALKDTPNKIDMLITDIRMSGLDGLSLLHELTRRKAQVPTLAITGFSDKDVLVELMRNGCQEYIEKPFEACELLEAVEKIIRKSD